MVSYSIWNLHWCVFQNFHIVFAPRAHDLGPSPLEKYIRENEFLIELKTIRLSQLILVTAS